MKNKLDVPIRFRLMSKFKSIGGLAKKIVFSVGLCIGSTVILSGHAHAQSCMGDLAGSVNCTANDVAIAETQVLTGPTECIEGDTIQVELAADLQSSSNSSRSDIGIWLAEDGGNAINGSCQHFYFDTDTLDDLDDNLVDDVCGDIGGGDLFEDVPLDMPTSTLDLVCRDGVVGDPANAPDGELDVGSCIAWKVPGQDAQCDDPTGGFPAGTLPGTKSKCNCSNITIPIIVKQQAYIEVVKKLSPNAGTFDLLIDDVVEAADVGNNGTTGRIKVGAGTATDPGADIKVSETGNLGLYDTVLDCVARDTGNSVYAGPANVTEASFRIEPDDDIICTFSNTGIPPKLTLVKNVEDGDANPDAFKLTVNGAPVTSGAAGIYAPGDYTAAETQLAGYTAGPWTGDCTADGKVTLALGDDKTCNITNTGIPPKLTIIKKVLGGGAAPDAFKLTVNGNPVTSGATNTYSAGSYTASETQLTGYTAGPWTGDCSADGQVSLALGDDKTCTITNTGIEPKLTLIKKVVGGSAAPDDFKLTVNGNPVTSGTTITYAAGDYTAAETPLSAYTAGPWTGDCAADGKVTLALGDDKTCTITNTLKPTYLTLVKVVENPKGAPLEPVSSFLPLTANGVEFTQSGQRKLVSAGDYTLSETNTSVLYKLEELSCNKAGSSTSVLNPQISVVPGDDVTCTFVNRDTNFVPTGELIVKKEVTNGYGGTASCSDFSFSLQGQPISMVQWDSSCMSAPISFDAGTIVTALEDRPILEGYTVDESNCANVLIESGDTKTCTIYNTQDEPPQDLYPTRTQGYWKTHPNAAAVHGSITICSDTMPKTVSTTSTEYCKLFSQKGREANFYRQAGAAALNCLEWGCPSDVQDAIDSCNYRYAGFLDRYNNGLEGRSAHDAEDPAGHGPADPKYCRR